MSTNGYLEWAIRSTKTSWWHDSADPAELQLGLDRGAVGVTTNPFLANVALTDNRELWRERIDAVLSQSLDKAAKAESLMRIAVTNAAKMVQPEYESSRGEREKTDRSPGNRSRSSKKSKEASTLVTSSLLLFFATNPIDLGAPVPHDSSPCARNDLPSALLEKA